MDSSLREEDILDPHPDIHALFCHYNSLYFQDALGACLLTWSSKRMTLCAGVCRYEIGGSCEIRLSEPLLKYRSSADLKNTLLHEMIHAYLWIKNNNKDHSDHGPNFQKLMNEINTSSVTDHQRPNGGYNINIYHSFHDEVNNYRVHHWVCQSCGDMIKRAMNREPSPNDCIVRSRHNDFCGYSNCHWHVHKVSCGGEYKKIAEPPGHKDNRKGSKGNTGSDGPNSEASTRQARTARKGPKRMQVKNESGVHNANTIESFYPNMSEVNKNCGSTLPSSDDLQNSFQFDDFHEPDTLVSTCPTRKDARNTHNEGRIKDKPNVPESNVIRNFYPGTSEANRSLDSASSSDYDLQNDLDVDEWDNSEEETCNHVVPLQKPNLQGHDAGRKKRKRPHAGGGDIEKPENYTVIIQWKSWYANEEEEDDIEPLHDKRAERRSKQKLLKNPACSILNAEHMEDVFHASSNSESIPTSLFKNSHCREHEGGPSTSHVNSKKQSTVLVEDDKGLCRTDLNDCAPEKINDSAASQGLADASGDCRSTGIKAGGIDIVELSDG